MFYNKNLFQILIILFLFENLACTSDLNDKFSWTPFYMIQPKTKFWFSVQNHDFWQALEGSDHFMPPPYQQAQYDIPTKERLKICY